MRVPEEVELDERLRETFNDEELSEVLEESSLEKVIESAEKMI